MASRTRRTPKKEADFLEALCTGASVQAACEAAKIGRRTVYDWRAADDDFALAWDQAIEAGTDLLEDEAKRRAFEGVEEPVFHGGQQCGTVRKYSDTLLIFLLKARRPEKFRERQDVKHSGAVIIKRGDTWNDEPGDHASQ